MTDHGRYEYEDREAERRRDSKIKQDQITADRLGITYEELMGHRLHEDKMHKGMIIYRERQSALLRKQIEDGLEQYYLLNKKESGNGSSY